MKRGAIWGARFVLIGFALGLMGCNQAPRPSRYLIFLDLSDSISQRQRDLWIDILTREILNAVGPGDELAIFGLHGRTGDSAPLFDRTLPSADRGDTYTGLVALQAETRQLREDAAAVIRDTLTPGKAARQSDIISAFDRVHPDSSFGATRMVFVSDMLNYTPELDLQTRPLQEAHLAEVIEHLCGAHRWPSSLLQHTEVYCLLNDLGEGDKGAANNRIVLHRFWDELIRSLAGRLVTFETHLGHLGLERSQS